MSIRGINVLPGVYYEESVEMGYNGAGDEIPVFIGKTNNSGKDGTEIKRYSSYNEVKKSVNDGGIGARGNETEDLKTNPLLRILKDFFAEIEPVAYDDITVPYIYVIDVGEGNDMPYWRSAINVAKTCKEITMEIFYGMDELGYVLIDVINEACEGVKTAGRKLDLRRVFFTIEQVPGSRIGEMVPITDYELMSYSISWFRGGPRLNFFEPANFGKAIARYCATELGDDAGYKQYNTIEPGTLLKRTPDVELQLQSAGVVFSRDEYVNDKYIPRINLGVATTFGKSMNERPADSLDSARRLADYILNKIFVVCFAQVKRRESRNNIVKLQSDIDAIVYQSVEDELVIESGTKLKVSESDKNPYAMIVSGTVQPINCTVAIAVHPTLVQPAIKAVEGL